MEDSSLPQGLVQKFHAIFHFDIIAQYFFRLVHRCVDYTCCCSGYFEGKRLFCESSGFNQ